MTNKIYEMNSVKSHVGLPGFLKRGHSLNNVSNSVWNELIFQVKNCVNPVERTRDIVVSEIGSYSIEGEEQVNKQRSDFLRSMKNVLSIRFW